MVATFCALTNLLTWKPVTGKHLNEALTRVGHPAVVAEGIRPDAKVGAVLSEAAARQENAVGDKMRPRLSMEVSPTWESLTDERVAELRGVTEH